MTFDAPTGSFKFVTQRDSSTLVFACVAPGRTLVVWLTAPHSLVSTWTEALGELKQALLVTMALPLLAEPRGWSSVGSSLAAD